MSYIGIAIQNPWGSQEFGNIFNASKLISKHKVVEFEVLKQGNLIIDICFRFDYRQDHSGVSVDIGIFGYSVSAKFYDTRHWDYENNRWMVY